MGCYWHLVDTVHKTARPQRSGTQDNVNSAEAEKPGATPQTVGENCPQNHSDNPGPFVEQRLVTGGHFYSPKSVVAAPRLTLLRELPRFTSIITTRCEDRPKFLTVPVLGFATSPAPSVFMEVVGMRSSD